MKKDLQLTNQLKRFVAIALILFVMPLFASGLELQQIIKEKKISINATNKTLDEILLMITKQSGVGYGYSSSDINKNEKYSLNVKEQSVEDALNKLFANSAYNYQITNNKILIVKRAVVSKNAPRNPINGKVVDEQNQPIVGATVVVVGTEHGAITDLQGKYSLIAAQGEQLEISYVGFKSITKTIGGTESNLIIKMSPDILNVDEVIVTGYQSINRKDMVGSYTTIKADDINMPKYSNISDMLQGQVAGMIVTNASSRVGASPKIQIRGQSTLLGNTDPIWVVDGIIQDDPININASTNMADDLKNILGNQVSWLNPNDIDKITILKDASATAIYGSRASNGVIVVTTKKGTADRVSISYSGNVSINNRPKYSDFNFMNSQERILFSEEAYAWGSYYAETPIKQTHTYEGLMMMFNDNEISNETFLSERRRLETVNTDWFDLLTRTSISQSHNASVSGGTKNITYLASFGYNNMLGQEIGNKQDRLTGRISVNMLLHKNIRVNVAIDGTMGNTKGFGQGVNPMNYATNTSRSLPAFDENGEYLYYQKRSHYALNTSIRNLGYNILNEVENSGSSIGNSRFGANMNLNWKMTKCLEYQFTGGFSSNYSSSESYRTEQTFGIASAYRGYDFGTEMPGSPSFKAAVLPFGGERYSNNARQSSYNIQNKILFNKEFNEKHRLNVMIATEVRSSMNNNEENTVYGYTPNRGETIQKPTNPTDIVPIGSGGTDLSKGYGILGKLYGGSWKKTNKTDNYFSLFATAAYNFDSRFVVNFNIRNDASNRFGQDTNRRFDPTYSLGGSWRATEESWLENSKWLTDLNLKATFGIQGNVLTNKSPELTAIQGGVKEYYQQYYLTIGNIPNPNLSWERTKTWNLGLDLQLFRKYNLTVDYYHKNSNAITTQEAAFEYGINTVDINGGRIYNSGLEFTVSFTPVNTENWGLNLNINSSKNWNKGGAPMRTPTFEDYFSGSYDRIIKEGYPVGAFWSYSYAGLDPKNGVPLFNKFDTDPQLGKKDPTSLLVYSGQAEPFFTGGINFNLRFKNLTLSTGLVALIGGKKRLPSPYASFSQKMTIPSPEANLSKDLNNRWKKPGDEKFTDIPGLSKGFPITMQIPGYTSITPVEAWALSDQMVANASFLRCRNLSLSWRVTSTKIQKIGIKNLVINASVNNLFVIGSKRFNGFDPELGSSVQPKSYNVGLNVGF